MVQHALADASKGSNPNPGQGDLVHCTFGICSFSPQAHAGCRTESISSGKLLLILEGSYHLWFV